MKRWWRENEKNVWIIVIGGAIGLMGFGLGRLTMMSSQPPVAILRADYAVSSLATPVPREKLETLANVVSGKWRENLTGRTSGQFVASANGAYYYPAACGAARRIKEANRVYFESGEEAEKYGFQKSKQCK